MKIEKWRSARGKGIAFILIGFIGLVWVSCTYDSREEVVPSSCDTVNVTFKLTIKPILDGNCLFCHTASDPAGGISFESFADTSIPAKDGRLVGSIKHLPGFEPMPEFAPMLPDCDIAKIEKWVEDGALNN